MHAHLTRSAEEDRGEADKGRRMSDDGRWMVVGGR
jgi:hypothetical protein